ncbi:zinc finger BED domain-containing protein 5-like [Palaemon carinicauda]|uniref:zinc finger BED domain-containing protein 5-like n=1 Tax=Palaemon carinicauda TaxID=392227 RepID=UPI0035B613AE
MCQEMGAVHISLILHTDIRWLSRGRVLNRVLELKEELKTFFQEKRHDIIIKLLENSTWWKLDWIVSPFELADMAEELDFTAVERDDFLDMSADSTLKVKFEKNDVTMAAFWHGTLEEYPNLAKKAISLLLPFSTS